MKDVAPDLDWVAKCPKFDLIGGYVDFFHEGNQTTAQITANASAAAKRDGLVFETSSITTRISTNRKKNELKAKQQNRTEGQ